jgi:hypothetical protein
LSIFLALLALLAPGAKDTPKLHRLCGPCL